MAPDGTFVVAWDAIFYGKDARGFDTDGHALPLSWQFADFSIPEDDSLDTAALGNDDFVVAWESYNVDSEPVIFARRFALDGTPLTPLVEMANGSDGTDHSQPAVESLPMYSNVLMAWAYRANEAPIDDSDIWAVANPVHPSLVGGLQINSYTTGPQDQPALSVGADSSFVVVWRSAGSHGTDDSNTSVQARWFASNGSPGPDFQVNTVTTGPQENPDVAVTTNGRFLVVWDGLSTGSDPDRSIQGRLFGPDQEPLTDDFQINGVTTGEQSDPAVALRTDGSFLVIWRSETGVWMRTVATDGTLVGTEKPVHSTSSELYLSPSVASSEQGQFVVTWDTEDDYYGNRRRARLFEEPVPSIFADGFESGDTGAW